MSQSMTGRDREHDRQAEKEAKRLATHRRVIGPGGMPSTVLTPWGGRDDIVSNDAMGRRGDGVI
jgi:hypothetical protein